MDIRPNLAKRRILDGLPVIAPSLGANSIPDLDTLDKLGAAGVLDVAWIEMEHGPVTWSELSNISRACDLWGITSLVRVTSSDPSIIGRTLDRGAQGVLVPHVNTKIEAERVVRAAYYTPIGMRGFSSPRQSYGVPDYFSRANEEIMVVVFIEEVEAVRNLPDILSVSGIDCFFVAPADLAQTMGPKYLGQPFHPDVQRVVRGAIEQIVSAGRGAGTLVNEAVLPDYLELGARFLRVTLLSYLEQALRTLRDKANLANC